MRILRADMEDCPELLLKKLCCTCLSQDRKLEQLCRLTEGINSLYFLLSYDSDAFKEGFYKDTVSWYICWECWAVMTKLSKFRRQACLAQKHLADIAYGRTDLKTFEVCLSGLTITHKTSYDKTIETNLDIADNFIDCGPDIKSESDEDIPLSEILNASFVDKGQYSDNETGSQEKTMHEPVFNIKKKNDSTKKKKKTRKCGSNLDSSKEYFTTTEMSEEEMCESRHKSKMAAAYVDASFKCESCVEGFKEEIDLNTHNLDFHTEKHKHTQCDICLCFIKTTALPSHRAKHYTKYSCALCDTIVYSATEIMNHLDTGHSIQTVYEVGSKNRISKIGERKSRRVLNPGSKPRRNAAMLDKRTPLGYQCAECDKYFDNKNQRWKHVQKKHREGYECAECGKRFAFKNNLARHQQTHKAPPPRQECPHCLKQVRVDLLKTHLRIHSNRQQYECAECDKRFASRASYEHHLKYTRAHAPLVPLRYKCPTCDKGYRSRGELRDHVNYQHMGKTQHKCPICGKALATRRCVGRHVRRHRGLREARRDKVCQQCGKAFRALATRRCVGRHVRRHRGVREARRDKVCQQCGKAFRDKKGLREHEFIHTGERPLSCEVCGSAFRQSASLYAHRKRVHRIMPKKKHVELLEPDENETRKETIGIGPPLNSATQ